MTTSRGQGREFIHAVVHGGARTSADLRPEVQNAVEELFFDGDELAPYVRRFLTLMFFATSIAAFGLLADSGAVVIGAMLVAPLMVPIQATAASIVLADGPRLIRSLVILAVGVVIAVATGWVVARLASPALGVEVSGEITARTFPGLLDLGIALAAGGAAGYILSRRQIASALPGTGIAVALVPPLAVVGIELERGSSTGASNALLLFGTNLAAIVLATALAFIGSGFLSVAATRDAWRTIRLGLGVVALVVLLVAVPLSLHTRSVLEDDRFRVTVTDAVATWDPTVRIVSLTADRGDERSTVDLTTAGPNEASPAWELVDILGRRVGGRIEITVSHRREDVQRAVIG